MPPGSEEAMREIDNTITMPIPLFDIGEQRGRREGRGGAVCRVDGCGCCLTYSVQYQTYQQAFLKMYAQLSARLELELAIAQHKRRQVTHPSTPAHPHMSPVLALPLGLHKARDDPGY